MTARAVAVEAAERKVVARVGDEGDVGEGRRHRRAVAGEAPGHALVRPGDRVGRVVARGGMALRARRGGWNVIGRLGGLRHVRREGRCRSVTAVAVAGDGVHLVEGLRTGISPGGRAARHHPEIRGGLVAGLTGGDPRGHGGVAGDRERRSGQARRTELEAARIDVARRVTARAVAVEAAYGEVIGGHPEERDRAARRGAGAGPGARGGGSAERGGAVGLAAPSLTPPVLTLPFV